MYKTQDIWCFTFGTKWQSKNRENLYIQSMTTANLKMMMRCLNSATRPQQLHQVRNGQYCPPTHTSNHFRFVTAHTIIERILSNGGMVEKPVYLTCITDSSLLESELEFSAALIALPADILNPVRIGLSPSKSCVFTKLTDLPFPSQGLS